MYKNGIEIWKILNYQYVSTLGYQRLRRVKSLAKEQSDCLQVITITSGMSVE